MEIDVPETLADVKKEVAKRQANGDADATEEDVIKETVLKSFQAYLEFAEEGHYDSAKWQGDNIEVTDVMRKPIETVKPQTDSFINDFKASNDALFLYLQEKAGKIAGMR
ncbi:hypothetical protein [Secundilactobacillus folii]|uniref:Uncharacterized protein n=1 Tax=Secundilactobacillus folii TaxID=2678357 RepID=A0A7X2XX79_9LACO|nr:hypothetical protein [Secundilactobacillus folii]MTV83276.1 hypothetical protein [Secundilactobacillus folii]